MEQLADEYKETSGVLPIWKFVLLSVITWGIYELVWSYRTWRFLEDRKDLDIRPLWRTFFASIFTGSLASHLRGYLEEQGIYCTFSPVLIGIGFFVLSMFANLDEPFFLVGVFMFVPLLPLVDAMNRYWLVEEEYMMLPPKQFTWWQTLLVALGCVLFAMAVLGMLLPDV